MIARGLPDGGTGSAVWAPTGRGGFVLEVDRTSADRRRLWAQCFGVDDPELAAAHHLDAMATAVAADPGAFRRWWL